MVFESEVRRLTECPFRANRIRDLQSAHHRHSSVARPLGRFVALFDAILGTAQESFGFKFVTFIIVVEIKYNWERCFKIVLIQDTLKEDNAKNRALLQ